jgi:transcriptional regulator with XRE-family HTH domain
MVRRRQVPNQGPRRATFNVEGMDRSNLLGEYLRARRDLVQPAEAGIAVDGRRRVPGLRRDELAELAGVSPDYYVRLEQGRDRHPSELVLDALARALQLDDDARRHLHELARPLPGRRPPGAADVPPGIERLIASWPGSPALVHDYLGNVLAANALAQELSPAQVPGVNTLRSVFLDPRMRSLYGDDWERIAESTVAGVRAFVGPDVDDPRLVELVGELSVRSEEFRTLWARHDARPRIGGGVTRLAHPVAGPLELHYEKLAVTDGDGLTLVVFHADPGSPSAAALERLAATLG